MDIKIQMEETELEAQPGKILVGRNGEHS